MPTGANFGCGSSREHAAWSLKEYGFQAIIASSFADIFYSNCCKNNLLVISLAQAQIEQLFTRALAGNGYELTINLDAQTIDDANGMCLSFAIDKFSKHCLINELDDIAVTLAHSQDIRNYEQQQAKITPWLFTDRK